LFDSGRLKIPGFLVTFGKFVYVLNVDVILDGKFIECIINF